MPAIPIRERYVETSAGRFRIRLDPDTDGPGPLESPGRGQIISLGPRDWNFDETRFKREVAVNPDAVILSYFEHGDRFWNVKGEMPPGAVPWPVSCRWMATGGCWVPDAAILDREKGLTGPERRQRMEQLAREACAVYNRWLNGGFWRYTVERIDHCTHCGTQLIETIDTGWGIDGHEDAAARADQAVLAAVAKTSPAG